MIEDGAVTAWICATCAQQHADTERPPEVCAICADERQWVPPEGQRWTSLAELADAGHRTEVAEVEPGLVGIGVTPTLGIGQRALVVRTDEGALLWDPPGFVDDAAVTAVREAGGLSAISASHPHFYGVAVEWSRAFDAPILLPEADRGWLMRPDPAVRGWSGELEVLPGVTLVQTGGHFDGSAVVHWADGAGGRGALLVGDTVLVTPGRDRVSFMRSPPNMLPLPADDVRAVVATLDRRPYDRIHAGWWGSTVHSDARRVVHHSAERYLHWLGAHSAG